MMKTDLKKCGLYIHVPYCRSKCPYCDFYSVRAKESEDNYAEAVCREIEKFSVVYNNIIDTIYIGGGTPSCINPKNLVLMLRSVRDCFPVDLKEVTVECNPSDACEDLFSVLAYEGVNRVSFGMQSAVDSERKALGRRADKAQIKYALECAKKAGISNISLDLMLGIPGQTESSLKNSVDFCAQMNVSHISAYMLALEEGTYFYKNQSKLNLPDDDETAELYLFLVDELEKSGYFQYEISNFAKPGFESRHNLKYWTLEDYLGIGASAHSFMNGKRFYYERSIEKFITDSAVVPDGAGGDINEKIMLGLRLKSGVPVDLLDSKKAERFAELGFAEMKNGKFSLTPKGCLISNSIINEFII